MSTRTQCLEGTNISVRRYALLASVLVIAGSACFEATAPEINSRLNAAKLGNLREAGEGCALVVPDGSGYRAVGFKREQLPFNMPVIVRNPKTGRGNGKLAQIGIEQNGEKVFLSCWIPGNMSHEQLARSVAGSQQDDRWRYMMDAVRRGPSLPDPEVRGPLSNEARAYALEMIETDSVGSAPSPRSATGGPQSSTIPTAFFSTNSWEVCNWAWSSYVNAMVVYGMTCGFGGMGWELTVTVCIYFLEWFDAYLWTIDNGYWQPYTYCQDRALNEIIWQYDDPAAFTQAGWKPACSDFSQTASTQYFTHSNLTGQNGSTWGILRPSLIAAASSGYGADAWREMYGGPRTASSGYRTPYHNRSLSGSAFNSRHMYGDALDLYNSSCTGYTANTCPTNVNTTPEFWDMYDAAGVAEADYREPLSQGNPVGTNCPCSGIHHVHADWRNH
jgi:hypothetical protein